MRLSVIRLESNLTIVIYSKRSSVDELTLYSPDLGVLPSED